MFASDPVSRLSTQMTRWPFPSSASQRWEPRNPAPPVTTDVGIERPIRPRRMVPPTLHNPNLASVRISGFGTVASRREAISRACLPSVVLARAGGTLYPAPATAHDFDEGVYLLSLGPPGGEHLGTDVFAAQPPAFYWMLHSDGSTPRGHVAASGSGRAELPAGRPARGSSFARRRAGRRRARGLAAPDLTSDPTVSARILADLPSLWATLAALGLGAVATSRRSRVAAVSRADATWQWRRR